MQRNKIADVAKKWNEAILPGPILKRNCLNLISKVKIL
jgi:hypothetical protein